MKECVEGALDKAWCVASTQAGAAIVAGAIRRSFFPEVNCIAAVKSSHLKPR